MQPLSKEQFLDFAEAYIGEKHRGKYREVFSDMMEGDRLSFNLSAAFASFLWFFYYKVYRMGFITLVVFLAFDPVLENVFNTFCFIGPGATTLKMLLPIAASVFWVGFYGNWYLYQHVRQNVYRLWRREGQNLPAELFMQRLRKKGGTSVWPIIWVSLALLVLSTASVVFGLLTNPNGMEKMLLEQAAKAAGESAVPAHCRGR